jgi:two-component system sensor histidine kinase HydH
MNPRIKITVIAVLAVIITIAHYMFSPRLGPVHEILGRAYYIPVVLGGLWFGLRGGLLTAFLISIPYIPHAFHGWEGPNTFIFRFLEIIMYHVIGAVVGILSARTREALDLEKKTRLDKEAAYEELRLKTEQLFTMEEQLRRSDRLAALGRLSAGLAHEIRNPLGSIKTCAEYLGERLSGIPRKTESHEDEPDFPGILLEETKRLNDIVTRFLEFVRDEKSQAGSESSCCSVSEAVHKTGELLNYQLKQNGISLELKSESSSDRVGIAEHYLQQVLLNLCLNSIGSIGIDGSIDIKTHPSGGGRVEMIFSDSGPGVPEAIEDRIFDPFFSTREGGTGLGLSIVERIITSHHGTIHLERSDDSRSAFIINLPTADG